MGIRYICFMGAISYIKGGELMKQIKSFYITPELLDKLDNAAHQMGVPRNSLVILAIESLLNNHSYEQIGVLVKEAE